MSGKKGCPEADTTVLEGVTTVRRNHVSVEESIRSLLYDPGSVAPGTVNELTVLLQLPCQFSRIRLLVNVGKILQKDLKKISADLELLEIVYGN